MESSTLGTTLGQSPSVQRHDLVCCGGHLGFSTSMACWPHTGGLSVMEYAPLVWMGAAPTHLSHLDRVQHRALRLLGPNVVLQSLAARRSVYALTYLYKLMCIDGPPCLTNLIPPSPEPPAQPCTRTQCRPRHARQLVTTLPVSAPDFLRRSFPYTAINTWNELPLQLLQSPPRLSSLHSFKVNVHRFLRRNHWSWATDHL